MLEIKSKRTSEEFDFTVIEYDLHLAQSMSWRWHRSLRRESPHTCSMAEVSGASALLKTEVASGELSQ